MLVIDPEECIDCGACEPECPVEAIFPEDALPEKWEPFVRINARLRRGNGRREHAGGRVRDRAQRPERAARVDSGRRGRGRGAEPPGGPGESVLDPYDRRPSRAFRPLRAGRAGRAERARFEAHLAECDRCPRAAIPCVRPLVSLAFVEESRAAAARAARTCPGGGAGGGAERRAAAPASLARRLGRPRVVAVAASAAAVGFGIWAATLHHSLASERAATKVLRDPHARHIPLPARGELVVAPTGDAVLDVTLPKPPTGNTYEAWVASPTCGAPASSAGHDQLNGARAARRASDGDARARRWHRPPSSAAVAQRTRLTCRSIARA